MGLTLTLTDAEIPASPAFIEFVHATLKGETYFAGEWYQQESEKLARNEDRYEDIQEQAKFVSRHEQGQKALLRSYRFFKEMLTGNVATLKAMQRFRFFFVIGIPRTGGTYLTKQLFRACDIDYKKVQNALAHDGFPHLAHLSFRRGGNLHTNGLLQLAEYMAMVEIFFSSHGRLSYQNGIVVPKKFTKATYYFDLIRELFGERANYLLTLRHPLAMCKSVIDKSGGLPEDGRFAVRSAIERWALEDWMHRGVEEAQVLQMDYIEVLLGYWKRFHFQMALSGMPALKTTTLVPYGQQWMTEAAGELFQRFGIEMEPEAFKAAEPHPFSPAHERLGEQTLQEVNDLWQGLGYAFPLQELQERL